MYDELTTELDIYICYARTWTHTFGCPAYGYAMNFVTVTWTGRLLLKGDNIVCIYTSWESDLWWLDFAWAISRGTHSRVVDSIHQILCLGVECMRGSIIIQATCISRKTLTVSDIDPAGDVANPFFSFKVLLRSEIINIRITSSKLDDSLPRLCFYWLVGPHISYLRQ